MEPREFSAGELLRAHLVLVHLNYPVTISRIKSVHPNSDEISLLFIAWNYFNSK